MAKYEGRLIRLNGDSKVAELCLNDVLESFRFRLDGGDFHDNGWNIVTVVAALPFAIQIDGFAS